MVKVAIYCTTPIAGAPFLQYECLKKYAEGIEVRHIQQRNRYGDGRQFPSDLFISQAEGKSWIKGADVVHIHNYLPPELEKLVDFNKQKVIATFHSCPRQGNWKHLLAKAHTSYCIRQPMQMKEYRGFPTLPNMFDIWRWLPEENKQYTGKINIVYCPTNKHQNNKVGSKGYHTVMPIVNKLAERDDIGLIHFSNREYLQNLRFKRQGHIIIDDIIGGGWHLTSIEASSFAAVALGSTPGKLGFPFIETHPNNIEANLKNLIDDRKMLQEKAQQHREWVEKNWNPKEQVKEFMAAYK